MADESLLVFVDGENLVVRYEAMLKSGRRPHPDTRHIPGCFVWNDRVFQTALWDVRRVSYHTSTVGDDVRIEEIRRSIGGTQFCATISQHYHPRTGQIVAKNRKLQIVPFVRKRRSNGNKESVCDVALAVDILRACYRDHARGVWLFSGDGDFVPLLQEVVHSGKSAYASAFSSGLNDEIKLIVDEFIAIDDLFFEPVAAEPKAACQAKGEATPSAALEASSGSQ